MRSRVVLPLVVLGVLVAGVAGWFGWQEWTRTSYQRAVEVMPDETLRATYTDWAGVRARAWPGGEPSQARADELVSRAYDRDLTGTSAVVDSAWAMHRHYGFSPLDVAWEMYGQSREGAVVALRLGESADPDAIEDRLARLGYEPPADGPGTGGVWTATIDQVAGIDPTLTPVMMHVVVLPEERVVLLSDRQAYASSSADVVTGDADGLDSVEGVPALADAAGEPVGAVMYAQDFACEALSMAQAGEEDQALADQLVQQAGGVSPLAGLVVARQPGGDLRVGMHFETAEQASDDLRPRVQLARGEAVGQGGTFAERFTLERAEADGSLLTMDLSPAPGAEAVLSDLTQGPVLFATCS